MTGTLYGRGWKKMENKKLEGWLQERRRALVFQVNGYNDVGFTDNADICQGQMDLVDELLEKINKGWF